MDYLWMTIGVILIIISALVLSGYISVAAPPETPQNNYQIVHENIKCPKCNRMSNLEFDHSEGSAGSVDYYYCQDCGTEFRVGK